MSRILKGEPAEPGGRRIEAAVFEAGERARAVVAAAEEEARRIRQEAEARRDAALAEAREAGRRDGLARAAAVVLEAQAARDRRLAALEREVAALALEVARKVLGDALSGGSAAVTEVAARAVAAARERREVTVRVHPADAPALREAASALARLLARAPGVVVQEDAALAVGDVVVDTESGRVDARLETQLSRIERALSELDR